jgi:prepilin-type N-terminal cleavage/methylation domain-containing protein
MGIQGSQISAYNFFPGKQVSAMKEHRMRTYNKGYTLIELIVVMAVFSIIILIAGQSFNTILKQNTKLLTSEESNIEGIVGLEIFRHDLEQAGFGLPSSYPSTPPSYQEAAGTPAQNFNDAANGIPRPVVAGNNLNSGNVLPNTDYLVIKGTTLGLTQASQHWTYVNYSSAGKAPKRWPSGNLAANDRAIVLRRAFTTSGVTNELVYDTAAPQNFYVSIPGPTTPLPGSFSPAVPQEILTIYGVDTVNLRMPFNRSDYFISRPAGIPSRCALNTGILYKTVVNHTDGNLTYMPILDCVADMQVVFGWDVNGDGLIDAYSDADGTNVSGASSSQVKTLLASSDGIRSSLKLMKIYILAQDGARDPNFTNSGSTILVGANGETSITKSYDLNPAGGPNLMNYRWKVYRIIVRPKNLSTQ